MNNLIEMLRYKRPEGSETQKKFCRKYLEPVFGLPDQHGNYIHTIGDAPNICFTSHHDTVHKDDGMQELHLTNGVISVADPLASSCLGADCTTGIWLMLNMIDAGVEGVYVVHAAEEIGCKGSRALVADNPSWLSNMDAVISFDRYGTKSVITHQMGVRTASEAFAKSFADALSMPQLRSDDGGSYTDSNEYSHDVSECTNISVGYYSQHTSKETQDLTYAEDLSYALVTADWSKLVFQRDCTLIEDTWSNYHMGKGNADNVAAITSLMQDHPEKIAELLDDWGIQYYALMDEADIDDMSVYNDYLNTSSNYYSM